MPPASPWVEHQVLWRPGGIDDAACAGHFAMGSGSGSNVIYRIRGADIHGLLFKGILSISKDRSIEQ